MTGFVSRHIGPRPSEVQSMLKTLGLSTYNELITQTIPAGIYEEKLNLDLKPAASENDALLELRAIASKNTVKRSLIGLGYYGTHTPSVIQRCILENPSWYTQYTPYQAEISQGRLESLLNFQTMICDLTGLAVSNASVLDEPTSAAEAMSVCDAAANEAGDKVFFISNRCLPQTIDVVSTRAQVRGIQVEVGDENKADWNSGRYFGVLLQYPAEDGCVIDYTSLIKDAKSKGVLSIVAADLLALCVLKNPGEMGADFAVGSAQRFGVPMGFGGPHAGYFSAREEHLRRLPGRIIGVSKDSQSNAAYRLSLQTREQHIRREKATSNICTAQALLANMAAMYAVYHGPEGLKEIASRVASHAQTLASAISAAGHTIIHENYFDTIKVKLKNATSAELQSRAESAGYNLRVLDNSHVSIALDETTDLKDLQQVASWFGAKIKATTHIETPAILNKHPRSAALLAHPIFNRFHSETELMRYITRLSSKDLSLTTSMIPLGSCTMKLNAASELYPVSWPEFGAMHPFAPPAQTAGYRQMIRELESMLCQVTGFDAISLQPNSGAQGEYAGLLAIRSYHQSRGDTHRNVCLIPSSAHGTNPASAAMAGMQVVVVRCDDQGNVDIGDLRAKAEQHSINLSNLMITYPSTHGVFEEAISEICKIIHAHGGQVYMDGANMNAQVGLCRPGVFGPDVCHLNLHKTFCIPHGGGGPGVGPIGVKKHLAPFLPGHVLSDNGTANKSGAISGAPWGSAGILPISWMYIRMMGQDGLREASMAAILNANYMAKRLDSHFPILYRGRNGFVAHECIIDLRGLQKTSGVTVEDIAKRLIDYGFHAPTMAWPVAGTLMIEPTESESKQELDRFCDAMISIRKEITRIENGSLDRADNPLKNAPHTAAMICKTEWNHPYTREEAAYPLADQFGFKFWPAVARVDNAYGDRNFVCTCPSLDSYENLDGKSSRDVKASVNVTHV